MERSERANKMFLFLLNVVLFLFLFVHFFRNELYKCSIFFSECYIFVTFFKLKCTFSREIFTFSIKLAVNMGKQRLNQVIFRYITLHWAIQALQQDLHQLKQADITQHLTYVHVFHARSRVFYYWGLGKIRLDGSYRRQRPLSLDITHTLGTDFFWIRFQVGSSDNIINKI